MPKELTSLEIVNSAITEYDKDHYKMCFDSDLLKIIKADLEILEILKEHLILIPTGTNKEQLFIATDITNYLSEKDKEDFNKVKQWLEKEENKQC